MINLLTGNYRLLNLNDVHVDYVEGTQNQLYEGYGHLGRFWFLEVKMCYGEADV